MLPKHRLDNVEMLRGFAALAVAWFHFTNGGNLIPEGSWLRASGHFGYLGVEVFFVISGFIIPYAMHRRAYAFPRDAASFAARRLIRLEPAYLLSVALVLALWLASIAISPMTAQPLPENLAAVTLAHVAYLAPWFDMPWLSPVYWSLAIEFQYYGFILVLAPLLLSADPWRVRAFLVLVIGLSFVTNDGRLFFFYLPLFGLGFLRFIGEAGPLSRSEVACWGATMSALAFVRLSAPLVCAGLLAVLVLTLPWPRIPRPLLFLGTISYSFYLLHVPIGGRVINLAARLPNTWYTQVFSLFIALSLSLIAAYVFYLLIERPTARWSHRLRMP